MGDMHQDFLSAQQFLSRRFNAPCTMITQDEESKEYEAYQLSVGNKRIAFRCAKTTPTKVGQFVTFWKRSQAGPIAPFDLSDAIDFFVVSVRSNANFGLFIFPQHELLKQDVISKNHAGGKRGFRVYPAWDKTDNKQAIKTQSWQLKHFHGLQANN